MTNILHAARVGMSRWCCCAVMKMKMVYEDGDWVLCIHYIFPMCVTTEKSHKTGEQTDTGRQDRLFRYSA